MLPALIELLRNILHLYNYVLFAWVILSWLISFNIVNRHQPFVYKLNDVLSRLVEPLVRPIRRFMPDLGGIDISPIVLILLLQFVDKLLLQMLLGSL